MAANKDEATALRHSNFCSVLSHIDAHRGEWTTKAAQDHAIEAFLQTNLLMRFEQPAISSEMVPHTAHTLRQLLSTLTKHRAPGKKGILDVFAFGADAYDSDFLREWGWQADQRQLTVDAAGDKKRADSEAAQSPSSRQETNAKKRRHVAEEDKDVSDEPTRSLSMPPTKKARVGEIREDDADPESIRLLEKKAVSRKRKEPFDAPEPTNSKKRSKTMGASTSATTERRHYIPEVAESQDEEDIAASETAPERQRDKVIPSEQPSQQMHDSNGRGKGQDGAKALVRDPEVAAPPTESSPDQPTKAGTAKHGTQRASDQDSQALDVLSATSSGHKSTAKIAGDASTRDQARPTKSQSSASNAFPKPRKVWGGDPEASIPPTQKGIEDDHPVWGPMYHTIKTAHREVVFAISDAVNTYFDAKNLSRTARAQYVKKPSPDLQILYQTVFQEKDWLARVLHLQTRPKPKELAQDDVLIGLIGAVMFREVFKSPLPWDFRHKLAQAFGAETRHLQTTIGKRGYSSDDVFKHASWIQIQDKDFQAKVVKPHAHELAQQTALTMHAHMLTLHENVNPPETVPDFSASEWMKDLERAFRLAITLKQGLDSHATGKFEYVWPEGDQPFVNWQHYCRNHGPKKTVVAGVFPGIRATFGPAEPEFAALCRVTAQ